MKALEQEELGVAALLRIAKSMVCIEPVRMSSEKEAHLDLR